MIKEKITCGLLKDEREKRVFMEEETVKKENKTKLEKKWSRAMSLNLNLACKLEEALNS